MLTCVGLCVCVCVNVIQKLVLIVSWAESLTESHWLSSFWDPPVSYPPPCWGYRLLLPCLAFNMAGEDSDARPWAFRAGPFPTEPSSQSLWSRFDKSLLIVVYTVQTPSEVVAGTEGASGDNSSLRPSSSRSNDLKSRACPESCSVAVHLECMGAAAKRTSKQRLHQRERESGLSAVRGLVTVIASALSPFQSAEICFGVNACFH